MKTIFTIVAMFLVTLCAAGQATEGQILDYIQAATEGTGPVQDTTELNTQVAVGVTQENWETYFQINTQAEYDWIRENIVQVAFSYMQQEADAKFLPGWVIVDQPEFTFQDNGNTYSAIRHDVLFQPNGKRVSIAYRTNLPGFYPYSVVYFFRIRGIRK